MRAMHLLAMEAPRFAALDEPVQDAQHEWGDETRSSLSGY